MNTRSLTAKLVLFVLSVPAVGAAQGIVSWKDENGVTHFGDRVPPEYANKDREVLNERGIVVDRRQGVTDEQRAEQERLAAEAEAKKQKEEQDRRLLQSYTKVSEIEAARDRRLSLVDGQIGSVEKSLADARARLAQHQQNAGRYKPYSSDPNAREIPTTLVDNIKLTEKSIAEYEETLAGYRKDRAATVESFGNDIRRFKELKGL
jgi:hypothetical protein